MDHLEVGERKYNVMLTKIRHICSSFNADLCNINKILNSICNCGVQSETAEHFFFERYLYNEIDFFETEIKIYFS